MTILGVRKADTFDLTMVKIPIVMGEPPTTIIVKYEEALCHLQGAVPQIEPVYPLALRVVTTFALTKADFVLDVVPVVGLIWMLVSVYQMASTGACWGCHAAALGPSSIGHFVCWASKRPGCRTDMLPYLSTPSCQPSPLVAVIVPNFCDMSCAMGHRFRKCTPTPTCCTHYWTRDECGWSCSWQHTCPRQPCISASTGPRYFGV